MTMCQSSAYVVSNKATDGQTCIKHDKAKTLSSMSLAVN